MITAYFILRVVLGLNILLHGLVRLLAGRTLFVTSVVREFEGSVLPNRWVKYFATTLPYAETMIGILLLAGLFTEPALLAGVALMLLLIMGKSLRQDWTTVSLQMIYIGFYAVLIGLSNYNAVSLDHIFLTIDTDRLVCIFKNNTK